MEGSTVQFSKENYSHYTSCHSTPAYHNAYGYISPPLSTSQNSTTKSMYASPVTGLGIARSHTFEPHHEQETFYTMISEHPSYRIKPQRSLSNHENTILPSQSIPRPNYTSGNRSVSYHVTSANECPPILQSPSMLVRMAQRGDHSQANYLERSISTSAEDTSQSSHFRYLPDPMQDGRWTIAAQEVVYTMPDERLNTSAWESDSLQQYSYHNHYAVSVWSTTSITSTNPL